MKPNKKVLDALILLLVITSIIIPITILENLKANVPTVPTVPTDSPLESELNRGIQVTYDEILPSDPIVILNPKECNIFYQSRYDEKHILLNYRTAPGVTVEEYILDGGAAQPIPPNNVIQTPLVGNHTLMLTGMNSTGGSCSSKEVNFYIAKGVPGICGAAPEIYFYSLAVHLARSGNTLGLVTDTDFEREIFLEGPQVFKTGTDYAKKVDLGCELINVYVPFIILRSEPWYYHCVEVINSYWINLVSDGKIVDRKWITTGILYNATDGETEIIYFLVSLMHVFGKVTYWNNETRYYDVINFEGISYFNKYRESYSANESIIEFPFLSQIDYSQFSGTYYDKEMTENESWGWQANEEWIQSYGVETNVFLGNYWGGNSCPVPVRFNLPQINEFIPDTIIHTFTRTDYQPDTFEANYRGLENTFSMNILPI
jgi:hypothetical protein